LFVSHPGIPAQEKGKEKEKTNSQGRPSHKIGPSRRKSTLDPKRASEKKNYFASGREAKKSVAQERRHSKTLKPPVPSKGEKRHTKTWSP